MLTQDGEKKVWTTMADAALAKRFVSIREACELTSLSRTTLFHKIKAREFPQPVPLSSDGIRKAFVSTEIEAWMDERIAARDKAARA